MKKIRIVALFLLFSMLLSSWVFATETQTTETEGEQTPVFQERLPEAPVAPQELNYPNELELEAAAYALVELKSNTIVHSKELDALRYPASLTKIMTCMLAIEYGNLDDMVTVSSSALQGLSIYGSTAGLVAGEEMTLENLLYCIMLWSANEGCNVIAEYVCGDTESFVALMNRAAQALGMKHRGLLKVGYAADICVLDYPNVCATSDYLYPFRKNKGISHVLVNGQIAVRNGACLGHYFGQVVCHEYQ
jgi:D-alanyl-D-alanine carboxypeptidase